jgi:Di-haem oxidoreductase, putative peroxidase
MTTQTMLRQTASAALAVTLLLPHAATLSQSPQANKFTIPKTWDDAAMADLEVPLANPIGSPKQISADYYYRIPVRPIYKQYPVYAPGREPAGYMDWLKQQEPVTLWDDATHKPKLQTEADWIKAGEIVLDAPIIYSIENKGGFRMEDVRSSAWYEKSGMPLTPDGILPFMHYVIREKGRVELGSFACGMCHTRVMPGGIIVKGAQGNLPFGPALAQSAAFPWPVWQALFDVPWLHPDPLDRLKPLSDEQVRSLLASVPPGAAARHRGSLFEPIQVPNLIGVKDRHYLDRTGLQQQRSIVDLMRYAALNQGADFLASFDGFIPADIPNFKTLPDPADPMNVGGRYSDEQLYALALYIYSLKPPPNPNKFDAAAARGEKLFGREGCSVCHTAPLYTNNKLTPAEGFAIPADHRAKYEILPISVGTDPDLTLKTRRGTGYYKVPSLKGVWYRSMFGHSGWCATLEDWLDPARLNDDYIPTGFKPYGRKTFAVKGHPFGLGLSAQEKKDLIAFLKTL